MFLSSLSSFRNDEANRKPRNMYTPQFIIAIAIMLDNDSSSVGSVVLCAETVNNDNIIIGIAIFNHTSRPFQVMCFDSCSCLIKKGSFWLLQSPSSASFALDILNSIIRQYVGFLKEWKCCQPIAVADVWLLTIFACLSLKVPSQRSQRAM